MTPARRTLLLSFLLAACGGGASGGGDRATRPLEPAVRDSAGVTLLEHPADALERAPLITIDSVPLATFAGDVDDPDKDLAKFVWPTFSTGGDLVGFDRDQRQLLVLRVADGRRDRYGRGGAGPGEFAFPTDILATPDDSLLIADASNNRIAFGHAGTGSVREVPRAGFRLYRFVARQGPALLGSAIDASGVGEFRDGGAINVPIKLAVWHPGEDSVRVVKRVDGGTEIVEVTSRSVMSFDMPFGPHTRIARWDADFLVGRAEDWSIERWDTAGQLTTVLRIGMRQPPVTDAMMEQYVQGLVTEALRRDSTQNADSLRQHFAARPHADRMAPYVSIHTAPRGTIWVRDYALESDSSWSATAIAPDGRILGRIVAAKGALPVAWGDDRLAFKSEDSNGIATITIRRLRFGTME